MTKVEFFRLCSTHNTYREPGSLGSVLKLTIRRETYGFDMVLELDGSWGGSPAEGTCLLSRRELYRPAGQMVWNRDRIMVRLRAEATKYTRWLKEWSETSNPHGVTVDLRTQPI